MIRRRDFALGAAAAVLAAPARAERPALVEMVRRITGGAALRPGRVTLDVPPLVENGNAVPLAVAVDSPMSEADHVRAIHVVNEKNPQPQVISAVLGPRAGRARLATRIKLADSQKVAAIAEMSDGSFWGATAEVVVTIAACVEEVK
jgi:sulfur-oxidizing protein SoxY